jgi:hypothetical protein
MISSGILVGMLTMSTDHQWHGIDAFKNKKENKYDPTKKGPINFANLARAMWPGFVYKDHLVGHVDDGQIFGVFDLDQHPVGQVSDKDNSLPSEG